jgi:hypothetical protein
MKLHAYKNVTCVCSDFMHMCTLSTAHTDSEHVELSGLSDDDDNADSRGEEGSMHTRHSLTLRFSPSSRRGSLGSVARCVLSRVCMFVCWRHTGTYA